MSSGSNPLPEPVLTQIYLCISVFMWKTCPWLINVLQTWRRDNWQAFFCGLWSICVSFAHILHILSFAGTHCTINVADSSLFPLLFQGRREWVQCLTKPCTTNTHPFIGLSRTLWSKGAILPKVSHFIPAPNKTLMAWFKTVVNLQCVYAECWQHQNLQGWF